MAFKELDKRNVAEVENSILESWGGINKITERQIENRNNSENFVFYDGPATANGISPDAPSPPHQTAPPHTDASAPLR